MDGVMKKEQLLWYTLHTPNQPVLMRSCYDVNDRID